MGLFGDKSNSDEHEGFALVAKTMAMLYTLVIGKIPGVVVMINSTGVELLVQLCKLHMPTNTCHLDGLRPWISFLDGPMYSVWT